MSFRYKINVLDELRDAGYSSTRLRRERLLGESYMSQLRRGEIVSLKALETICRLLNREIGDILELSDTDTIPRKPIHEDGVSRYSIPELLAKNPHLTIKTAPK